MLKPPLQGILFDFDGLILDTETPIFQAWQEMYRKYGEELILEDWAEILGKSVEEMEPLKDFFRAFRAYSEIILEFPSNCFILTSSCSSLKEGTPIVAQNTNISHSKIFSSLNW